MCKTNRAQPTSDGAFSAKLAALAAMPARLAQIATSIAPAQWKTRARDGGFSLQEHAAPRLAALARLVPLRGAGALAPRLRFPVSGSFAPRIVCRVLTFVYM